MTPSVPDWGLGRAVGVGDGCWGVVALERPQGANGRSWGDSVPRTSACTDISPLACTTNNAAEISAGWKSGARCGYPARRMVSEQTIGHTVPFALTTWRAAPRAVGSRRCIFAKVRGVVA